MRWPHDRDAERAVIGNSLYSADWHHRARHIVEPADFFFTEHQAIFQALDELHDIGPLVPVLQEHYDAWTPLWPLTPPLSLRVRCAAVWTLGPYGAPLAALHRLAEHANGNISEPAHTVAARACERREIQAALDRVYELAGTRR